jgi:hypothetical protein
MEEPQSQTAEWVENLLRDFQDKLTCGLYETLYTMDDSSVDTLMEGQARTCVSAFVDLTSMSVPMDLDSFLETMAQAAPARSASSATATLFSGRSCTKGSACVRLSPAR